MSVLKQMMDRLVCADVGNPAPTSTANKDPSRAKALDLQGCDYPKHLAGRACGVVVHGDVAGIESVRRALTDWLDWMGLIDVGRALAYVIGELSTGCGPQRLSSSPGRATG